MNILPLHFLVKSSFFCSCLVLNNLMHASCLLSALYFGILVLVCCQRSEMGVVYSNMRPWMHANLARPGCFWCWRFWVGGGREKERVGVNKILMSHFSLSEVFQFFPSEQLIFCSQTRQHVLIGLNSYKGLRENCTILTNSHTVLLVISSLC